jgi:two-component system, LuxR family, sensor kinase FixL
MGPLEVEDACRRPLRHSADMSSPTNGGRSRSYQALRESEELHRATLSSISDAVFMTDDAGTFTYVCPNVDVIFGYTPDEVRAMGRLERLLGDRLFEMSDLVARGEIRNVERDVTSKSGQPRAVLIHLKLVSIQGGTVLCTCRDVTELKQAERELAITRQRLVHAGRLALLGELTAMIVHEVKQPLSAIFANVSAATMSLSRNGNLDVVELRSILDDIQEASGAAADIVDRLRALATQRPREPVPLDLNDIARDTLRMLAAEARRRNVSLREDLHAGPIELSGDRVSLQQLVTNLIANAIDAAEDSGEENCQVIVSTGVDTGAWVLSVTDNGRGIAPQHLPRLFDAFFTTRDDGVGLGLAIARSIAEEHGGRLSVQNNPGRGATFRFELPAR